MKYLFYLVFVTCFTVTANYAQKRKIFENVPEYSSYVEETGVDKEKIVVLNKDDYYALGDDMVSNQLYTFYGIIYNSALISASHLEDKSCWGQFRDLCKSVSSTSTGTNIADIPYLKNLDINQSKKTIIFIYSCDYRGLWKKSIKPVLDAVADDPDYDYILLSKDVFNIRSLSGL